MFVLVTNLFLCSSYKSEPGFKVEGFGNAKIQPAVNIHEPILNQQM